MYRVILRVWNAERLYTGYVHWCVCVFVAVVVVQS